MNVNCAGMPGGVMDVNVNIDEVQNALKFAVSQHNKASNNIYISQVSRLIKAQAQVVGGVNYIFTVEMARTSCRKGFVANVCYIHPDPRVALHHVCQLKVWEQVWLNDIRVLENTCL
ncbi:cystatin-like [Tachysurus vachellii]|uniref:cystatin-like n=1 Tax=Tachysurus vachellii TaxID=175792 RepID=UPI00296B1AFF|nr:cystatin-like [Tachysurus vachellii]